jgi:hypothetical protein
MEEGSSSSSSVTTAPSETMKGEELKIGMKTLLKRLLKTGLPVWNKYFLLYFVPKLIQTGKPTLIRC